MGYSFKYAPGVVQYIILHVLQNPVGIHEWGKCLHLNVVGQWNIVQTRMLHRDIPLVRPGMMILIPVKLEFNEYANALISCRQQ